jgi:NAD(P)-dependent dehydrogenase (short-subunit alcohol dehydrogenase family)
MSSKTCVVVGVGPGLGLGVARKFGKEGFRIALIARGQGSLASYVETLASEGIEARAFPADVTDRAGLAAALGAVRQEFGPVEVLFYGPEPHTPPQDLQRWIPATMAVEEVERRMDLSVYGLVTSVAELLPDMQKLGKGTILATMGASGVDPFPTLTPCGMSYAAAANYLLALGMQVKKTGIYAAPVFMTVLVEPGDPDGDPDVLAGKIWQLHLDRNVPLINFTTTKDIHEVNADDMKKYGIEIPDY